MIADPIVALLLQFECQFFIAAPDDATLHHNMYKIGNNVVQQPLVMRDEQNAEIGAAQ